MTAFEPGFDFDRLESVASMQLSRRCSLPIVFLHAVAEATGWCFYAIERTQSALLLQSSGFAHASSVTVSIDLQDAV
jgi:hypothetical protein